MTRKQLEELLEVCFNDYETRSIGVILLMMFNLRVNASTACGMTWDKLQDYDLDEELEAVIEAQREDFGFQQYVAPRPKLGVGELRPFYSTTISEFLLDHVGLTVKEF